MNNEGFKFWYQDGILKYKSIWPITIYSKNRVADIEWFYTGTWQKFENTNDMRYDISDEEVPTEIRALHLLLCN